MQPIDVVRIEKLFRRFSQDKSPPVQNNSAVTDRVKATETKLASESGDDDREPKEGYVISISKKRRIKCLHLIRACDRRPGEHYQCYVTCGATAPASSEYNQVCKTCWPTETENLVEKTPMDSDNSEVIESSSSEDSAGAS